jgi:tetratricopeptide (TPR) repeat protein
MENQPRYTNKTVFLIITLLCFILYGNTLQNGYNLDDAWAFQDKGDVGLVEGLQESFTTSYVSFGQLNYGYRPVTSAVFELEQAAFGQNPVVSHFINVLFYSLVCYLLFFWLTKSLKIGWWVAAAITVVFLFLPIHTEVVNSVKNRDELLSSFFGLLFLIQTWKFYKDGGVLPIVLATLFFLLSVFSKQSTLPLIAIAPIGLWITANLNKKRLLIVCGVFISLFIFERSLGSFIDLGAKKTVHDFVENPLYGDHTGAERLMVATNSLGFYVTGMFSVGSFAAYYGLDSIDFLKTQPIYMVGFALYVALGLGLLILYFKKRKYKFSFFAMVFMTGCLFPFLNLVVITPGVVGERLTFLASMGFSLILGAAIYHLFIKLKSAKSKTGIYVSVACLGAVTLFWSAKTIQRNSDWYDLESLMKADLETYPRSLKMNMIMGSVQYNKGVTEKRNVQVVSDLKKVELARSYFVKALETYDKHAVALYNIAWMDTYLLYAAPDSTEQRWWELVEMEILDSVSIEPHIITLLERQGEVGQSLELSMKLCEEGNSAMGLTGMRIAMNEEKWEQLWKFSECVYPDIGQRRLKLTEMWKRLAQKDSEKAKALMTALMKFDESPYYGKINVQGLMQKQDFAGALLILNDLDQRFPNDLEIKLFYGNIYTSFNQKENALRSFKEALALDPENEKLKKYVESLEN